MVSYPSLNPENYAALRRDQKNYTIRDLGPGLMIDYLWFNLNPRGKPYRSRKNGAL